MAKWDRTAHALHAAALASHAVCCGAPLVLNLLALAFGAGMITAAAPWMESAHGALHGREGLLLTISAALVAAGGITQYLSWRADCSKEDAHCHHEPCAPKKPRRLWIFAVVCALFMGNVALYAWHQGRTTNVVTASEHHDPA